MSDAGFGDAPAGAGAGRASATIEFALLGRLEIRSGGRLLRLDAPKRRALVAVLLLNANRVVSLEELVDALWGPSPPASARAQVQSLVHAVRSLLAEEAGSDALLETRMPGYLMTVAPGQLDLLVFERRVAQAREAVSEGRVADGVDRYHDAERLWQGPALDGVDAPFARRHAACLEEQRLCLLEERIELELALRRHAALVPELSMLTSEHPFREQLRSQLMLALYRCGRQADALDAYRRGRDLLVDELGIEPGAILRGMQQSILAGDPALDLERPRRGVGADRDCAAQAPAAPAGPPASAARAGADGRWWRPRVPAALLVVAAVALIAAVFATRPDGDRRAARTAPPTVSGPAWVREPGEPVSAGLFGVTLTSSSGAMPSFRVGAVRLWDSHTRWANVQPRRSVFDWAILDRLVASANAAGLPVLYTIGGTPAWASPGAAPTAYDDGSRTSPPRRMADWERFVRAVARRYRTRIEAYELWNLANNPRYYDGNMGALVDMTRRANRIIKRIDPRAIVVCPSMGELWKPAMRDFMRRFGVRGGYRHCDVAAVKMHQRRAAHKPETIVQLAAEVDRTFHRAGVHKRMWNTGSTYDITLEPPLARDVAANYAVRFYLAGLFIRYERMYYYNWGGTKIPIVLQAEGGAPTQAALFVEELQRWLAAARIRSCRSSLRGNLPANVWECEFTVRSGEGDRERAAIRWAVDGEARMTVDSGAYRLQRLDGGVEALRAGEGLRITERPVLIRYRDRRR